MANSINVNQNNNNVSLQDANGKVTITDDKLGINIEVTQPVTNIVTVSSLGPQGQSGAVQETGSFVLTSSFNEFTSSYYLDSASFNTNISNNSSSIALLSGSFEIVSSSFSARITNLEDFSSSLDATFATDAELNAATASLSASISNLSSSFETFSGSYNTGSFTGSFEGSFTGDLNGTASYALNAESASYALTSSYVENAQTASYVEIAQTASYYDETDPVFTAVSGTFVLTSSFNQFTSSYNTGSFTGSFKGNLIGTASYSDNSTSASLAINADTASNVLGGKATHVPYFITDTTLATSSIFQSGSTSVIINQDNNTTANPEALYVWQPNTSSINVISGKGNLDNYLQLNIQNTNQGEDASSDIVATANNGSETDNYIDMGINSENFDGFLGGPNDSYLYAHSHDMWIGNINDGYDVNFFNSSSEEPIIKLTPTGQAEITGSLFGTSSWAENSITSSYAITASHALNVPLTASYAISASHADLSNNSLNSISASHAILSDSALAANYATIAGNGGVTSLIAGAGITLSPPGGTGNVTVISSGGGGVTIISGSNITSSFVNSSTWTFNHGLGIRTPTITVFDSNYNQIIPQNIELTDTASAIITFPTLESGFAVAMVGGVAGNAYSASYSLFSTYADTASYYNETDPIFVAKSGSFATTGSNIFKGNQTVTGSLIVTDGITGSLFGTSSYTIQALTSSYVTGSIFKNGNTALSASYALTASYYNETDPVFVAKSGSLATTGSNIFIGNQIVTGSLFTTGSNTLIGITTLTGSLNITGSTTQTGNNTLIGNTTLSGSITISGSSSPGDPTASVQIYGDIRQSGYHRFDPVTTNINTSISASYIYVSGSTNDLYFSQNSSGYNNVTRLRWLEGSLFTGLLSGGIISAVTGSTTYQISSGSGIIVSLNASYTSDPSPTVQHVNWPNLTGSIASLSSSFDQQFVSINSSGSIIAQGTPYVSNDYNISIPIGIVLHQNRSTINAVQTFPSTAYGWKQRSSDFVRAFGPLKISGYILSPSGSSTGGIVLSGGTSFVDGRNYIVDPNNPSYINEAVGITTSKIFYYHQSGSGWVYNTNGGIGYSSITASLYSNNGTLTPVPTNDWSIQRVYYFPNSATKAFYVYYGNAHYATKTEAISAITTETFSEAPNTAANAVLVGYMVLRYNADFTVAASYELRAGGLFRSSGIGGGGGGGATSPGGLTTQIQYNNAGAFAGSPNLTYDGSTLRVTGSLLVSGSSTFTNIGLTSLSGSVKVTGSLEIAGNIIPTTSSSFSLGSSTNPWKDIFIKSASINIQSDIPGDADVNISNANGNLQISAGGMQLLGSGSFNATTGSFQYLSGSLNRVGDDTQIGNYIATGSITSTVGFTGSLQGTSSWASNASTASYVQNAQTASYVESSSFASTASYVNPLNQNVIITGSLRVSGSLTEIGNTVFSGSVSISGSFTTNDGVNVQTITASFISASSGITGSLFGTSSYAVTASYALSSAGNSAQGAKGDVQFRGNTPGTFAVAANNGYFTWTETNNNTGNNGLGALQIGPNGASLANNPLSVNHNINSYAQLNVQNNNNGNLASSDIVATANNGTDNTRYIDLGINSSTYNDPTFNIGGANDGYLYVAGGNISIGTDSAKDIVFHTNGTTSTQERVRITSAGTLNVIGNTTITGSLTVSGSITEVGPLKITGATTVTGSVTVSTVLTLPPQSPLPSGQPTGSLAVSGSGVNCKIYFFNGTWNPLF